jgi:hypothetical protein
MRQPDGRWPCIGDVDGARSIPVHHDDFWAFQSVSSLGAALFGIEECKDEQAGPGPELYWLAGTSGIERWSACESKRPKQLTLLPTSGYAIGRSVDDSGDWFLLDSGPIAAGLYSDGTPSVAHGHNDIFQVLYSFGGRSVLEDSGMLRYAGDRMWVDCFRSAAAHSTIDIDGLPMAKEAGRLGWAYVREPERIAAANEQSAVIATGRVNFGNNGHVVRQVLFLPGDGIWIADVVRLDRPRTIEWYWQLTSECVPHVQTNDNAAIEFTLRDNLAMRVLANRTVNHIVAGYPDGNSPIGWRSPSYGVSSPARRVSFSVTDSECCVMVTAFGTMRRSVAFVSLETTIVCQASPVCKLVALPPITSLASTVSWFVDSGTDWERIEIA